MKIVMVSGHACVRVQKMAIPLIELGHDVHLIAGKTPTYYEYYSSFVLAPSVRQYRNAIELHAGTTDVFHCHNEPSWFVSAVKEATDAPVVLDVHDSHLVRVTPEEEDALVRDGKEALRISIDERNNFQMADGLVFVSEPFADVIKKEFKLQQPSLVLPSYLPDFMMVYEFANKAWLGGLVYEGRVDLSANGTAHGYRYCCYLELAKKAKELGIDFHLYPGRDLSTDAKFWDTFQPYAVMHTARSINSLLPAIARHDWGLVGNLEHTPDWEVAFPNKLFEYIAAGVPVVAINAKRCSEFVEKHGIGITVDSLGELTKRWGEHREIRKRIMRCRKQFEMQKHIDGLTDLYGKVGA